MLGAIAIFLYVAVEVIAGDTIGTFCTIAGSRKIWGHDLIHYDVFGVWLYFRYFT